MQPPRPSGYHRWVHLGRYKPPHLVSLKYKRSPRVLQRLRYVHLNKSHRWASLENCKPHLDALKTKRALRGLQGHIHLNKFHEVTWSRTTNLQIRSTRWCWCCWWWCYYTTEVGLVSQIWWHLKISNTWPPHFPTYQTSPPALTMMKMKSPWVTYPWMTQSRIRNLMNTENPFDMQYCNMKL